MTQHDTTIAAIATPHGQGGIAVIRLSGPDALTIAQKIWKGRSLNDLQARTATLGTILDRQGEPLDEALITTFRAPASFTGEDVVEFAVHGSKYIQQELLKSLIQAGATPAAPGEYTQRAFLNGRLDLTQAEAIADIIAAESRAANRLAQSQASGRLARHLNDIRQQLIDLASLLELELDFSEEDVTFADRDRLLSMCSTLKTQLQKLIQTYNDGKAFREGIPVAIIGEPNAGKSTLLNTLLDDNLAIVSDIPGTTRDIIQDTRQIDGILFRFIDTAGLRDTDDRIEQLGIDRALAALRSASIILHLVPISESASPSSPVPRPSSLSPDQTLILVRTKADLAPSSSPVPRPSSLSESAASSSLVPRPSSLSESAASSSLVPRPSSLSISCKTGQGLDELKSALHAAATRRHNPDSELMLTNARHYAELRRTLEALDRVEEGLRTGLSADFVAQDLRAVIDSLSTLTGSITTPDILATIFSRFCIGK